MKQILPVSQTKEDSKSPETQKAGQAVKAQQKPTRMSLASVGKDGKVTIDRADEKAQSLS